MESAEIAEDFKDALEDLKVNSKPEIDNLTVIAKENTAHAQAISSVLEQHIESTRPEWKLPALYVLDSLIRHIGPPYSTYLGRNLFRTFMEAYRQVNNQTRKDLEAVLRTWKEPPQGSRDPRPVLPMETTQPIENALLRFKTVALQSQPQNRPLSAGLPPHTMHPGMNGLGPVDMNQLMGQLQHRTGTPTFSQAGVGMLRGPPVVSSPIPQPAIPATHSRVPSYSGTPVKIGQVHQSPFQPVLSNNQPSVTQTKLENDVRQLLQTANLQRILDSSNKDMPQLIATLESLKGLLDTQQFKETDLLAMQGELSKISARMNTQITSLLGNQARNTPPPAPTPSLPMNPYPAVSTPPNIMPFAPPIASMAPLVSTPPPPVLPVAAPNRHVDVASILSLLGPTPPPNPNPVPQIPSHAMPPISRNSSQNATPQPPTTSLLDQLRLGGLLSSNQQPTPTLPVSLPVPPTSRSGRPRYGVRLDQESITKVKRKHFIGNLYEANQDQCRQCGRRFPNTKEGKEKKIKHLDWHFSVKSRVADATRTGIVHRSPYLDEIQWTRLRESQDDAESGANGTDGNVNIEKGPTEVFIPAPTDVTKLNEPCSICMERFNSVWHEKTQQPVWMDAMKVGNKYYHVGCYKEVYGGANTGGGGLGSHGLVVRNGARHSRDTPDRVLGKRKYEGTV